MEWNYEKDQKPFEDLSRARLEFALGGCVDCTHGKPEVTNKDGDRLCKPCAKKHGDI